GCDQSIASWRPSLRGKFKGSVSIGLAHAKALVFSGKERQNTSLDTSTSPSSDYRILLSLRGMA
ncbi:hypothetical protein, partial [Xanthomonas albilineans]|uniref:hypothetical protein n=1 Tax=Xanthomonas albilineans TaxID=29447 RepID=UPI001F277190